MAVVLSGFTVGLQTKLLGLEQFSHDGVADLMAECAQLAGQAAQTLTGPAKRRHRVTALTWANQRKQILQQRRVGRGQGFAPSANTAIAINGHRGNARESTGINADLFTHSNLHVHVPAGATPKDGPSAGVAMFVALSSLMTGRAVPPTTAMTGEISLRGLVLPVGGIREKVIAAARAGIDTVLLPARNRRDYDDIPPGARDRLRFVWLDTVDDALMASIDAAVASQA